MLGFLACCAPTWCCYLRYCVRATDRSEAASTPDVEAGHVVNTAASERKAAAVKAEAKALAATKAPATARSSSMSASKGATPEVVTPELINVRMQGSSSMSACTGPTRKMCQKCNTALAQNIKVCGECGAAVAA